MIESQINKQRRPGIVGMAVLVGGLGIVTILTWVFTAAVSGEFRGTNTQNDDGSSSYGSQTDCSGVASVPSVYMPWVKDAAAIYLNGDEAMLITLIQTESSWKPSAQSSSSSATGLGQYISGTAKSMPEFVGGNDKHGTVWPSPAGQTKGNVFGTPDSRTDAKRSIYAVAHSLNTLGGQARMKGKSPAEIYRIGYHTGDDAAAYAAQARFEKIYNGVVKGCTTPGEGSDYTASGTPCGVVKVDTTNAILSINSSEAVMMPPAANAFNQMAKEWRSRTGKKLAVVSMFRSRAKQIRMYNNDRRGIVAKPGGSMHEAGLAIDVGFSERFPRNPQGMNSQEYQVFKQIANKYNFTVERVSGGNYAAKEAWHFNFRGTPYYYGPSLAAGIQKANAKVCSITS